MKFERLLPLILAVCFFAPSTHYADDNNLNILPWAEETLLSTLAINYTQTSADRSGIRQRYTMNAWMALQNFFSEQIAEVKNKHLTIHPKPLTRAVVVEQGVFSGILYWRVNQSFLIPELNSTLNFSLIIIKGTNPPYMVQSVNILRHTP